MDYQNIGIWNGMGHCYGGSAGRVYIYYLYIGQEEEIIVGRWKGEERESLRGRGR